MGQNQILMILLAVIIIGIAVTVGITQFGEGAVAANRDALAGDCQRVIATAQQWRKKPVTLGGGGNSFSGVTMAKLGLSSANENGSVALTEAEPVLTCTGTSVSEENGAGDPVTVTMRYSAATDSIVTTDNL